MACNAVWLPDGPACRWVLKRLFRGFSVAVNIAGPADKPDVGTSFSKDKNIPLVEKVSTKWTHLSINST